MTNTPWKFPSRMGAPWNFAPLEMSLPLSKSCQNELSTPKLLYCRSDSEHAAAVIFGQSFGSTNISYFVSANASALRPNSILCGDDNLQLFNSPVGPGLVTLPNGSLISWTASRHLSDKAHFWTSDQHRFIGNIAFADGSARHCDTIDLQQALQQTGTNTTRIAIP